jgi:hypothetical protein
MTSLQISLLVFGAITLAAVIGYNVWTSSKNAPRQADFELKDGSQAIPDDASTEPIEPQLVGDLGGVPLPEKKPFIDPLIDAITPIELEALVSGDAILAALPPTRRVGTKPFSVEGLNESTGEWEAPLAGRRYSAAQAAVQLANRVGPINDIEFSEFVIKAQAVADDLNGETVFPDMLDEVARGRDLDQFASAHDAQLSFTLTAKASAWSPGYIHQHAARLGFVAGVIPGRMVLPGAVQGAAPILSLVFDTQAAMADDPALSAIRELTISLDVPQINRTEAPFSMLRDASKLLAQAMDGVVTDGGGHVLSDAELDAIAADLQQLYDALDQRELSAGSPQARRLFS